MKIELKWKRKCQHKTKTNPNHCSNYNTSCAQQVLLKKRYVLYCRDLRLCSLWVLSLYVRFCTIGISESRSVTWCLNGWWWMLAYLKDRISGHWCSSLWSIAYECRVWCTNSSTTPRCQNSLQNQAEVAWTLAAMNSCNSRTRSRWTSMAVKQKRCCWVRLRKINCHPLRCAEQRSVMFQHSSF